ncbi:ATP-dependent DNA helicase RecQ-like [Saccostrea cucullata]|uniref:ATP-dependent DNA helicase RecQ-like n=1 Tax=Saccostrea cuccullata TaxID=36930 RepID=UPI002ED54212
MADVDRVVQEVLKTIRIKSIKNEQKLILKCLIENRDCVAVLPTGFGKSLPFQLYLPVKRALEDDESFGKVIVCCLLVSLMQDQVNKLSSLGLITAAFKGKDKETDDLIEAGKVDIICASPESLVGDSRWRQTLQKLHVTAILEKAARNLSFDSVEDILDSSSDSDTLSYEYDSGDDDLNEMK